jgi:hypothetical protein
MAGGYCATRFTKRRDGEAPPHFITSQWIYAEITSNGKRLPIGAKPHASVIFRPVSWIENCSIFIVRPLPFHTFDNRQTKPRRILLGAGALGTDRVGILAGLHEYLDEGAAINAVVFRNEKPTVGLPRRDIDLLPKSDSSRFGRLSTAGLEAENRYDHYNKPSHVNAHPTSPCSPPCNHYFVPRWALRQRRLGMNLVRHRTMMDGSSRSRDARAALRTAL